MLKAVVLDIDGVIVGSKKGVNFPLPHPKVIKKLQKLNNLGIKVSLCSAKGLFAFRDLIKKADLDGLHIADSGALVYDNLLKKIVKHEFIDGKIAKSFIADVLNEGCYFELYYPDKYLILKKYKKKYFDYVKMHSKVLQAMPELNSNVNRDDFYQKLTKIVVIIGNNNEKIKVEKIFAKFNQQIELKWTVHPTFKKGEFGVISPRGISKSAGLKYICHKLKIPLTQFLGVGDTIGDWDFIKYCAKKATLENGTREIKKLILNENNKNSFIGPGVDENGILKVFDYFGL